MCVLCVCVYVMCLFFVYVIWCVLYVHVWYVYVWYVYMASSVTKSCPNLCNPMDCSTLGFPVHHQLPELAQTHVH